MKFQETVRKDGAIRLTVTLEKDECSLNYQKALKKISANFSQKGFRDGKVPEKIILQRANDRLYAIYEEISLRSASEQAFNESKLVSILSPEIKIIKSVLGESFVCEILVVPYPKVQLGQYKNLAFKKTPLKINEQEIKDSLEFLRQSRATFQNKEEPSQQGDQLDISFDAFYRQAKIETASAQHYPLRLGKSHLYPEFEKHLYGTKAGDEKKIKIDFPKNWAQEEFKGKTIHFNIKVNSVQKVLLPDLNDKFAQSLGNFQNLASLKKSLREGLLREKEQEQKKKLEAKIIQKIIDSSQFNIAEALIYKQKQSLYKDLLDQLEKEHLKIEDYLKRIKISKEDLDKSLIQRARNILRQAFVLYEIAKIEKLFPSQEEIESSINERLKKSQNYSENIKNIDLERLQSYTFEYLTNQKVIQWLFEKNTCV